MSEPAPRRTLAQKLDRLFRTVHAPGGGEYTYREVAAAMARAGGPTISASYVWHLRTGLRDNPTKRHLEALADFFGVPPAYFFDDEASARIDAELEVALALRDPVLRRLAVRAAGLSRESLVALAEMVERVRLLEGLPPVVDGPSQPAPASRPTNSRRRRPRQQRPADPPSA
jgi:transcriptional regulator with XRE-family HTH domain